ncbi:hypothetical protein BLNAU_11385 [Blattamonas nauphoetae]|uniref:Uncharacterized protein n=1 Tax=Blattamonas nauphoetae TaxID=2049346 RepID=A0ABQ9XRS9_9EUKA|nr:hypothetical protein BLNAU_11385 [Blattamonas nauphoetae]
MFSLLISFHACVAGAPPFELTDLDLFLSQQIFFTSVNSLHITRTIRLPRTDFVSNTVRFKDQKIRIEGEELVLSRIFEGHQARESLISASNSTVALKSLSLETISTRAVIVTDASVCHLSDSHVFVLKHLSPMEISASSLVVDSTRFSFPQSTSPSLCTTDSTSSTVLFRQCSFLDVFVESGGSFLTCPRIQQLDVASTRFSNISHCPTYFGADPHVRSFNVSLHDSQFDRCENVLDGGVIRNVNSRTTLFASNTTFTLSQTTYTLVPDTPYEETQIPDITTNHNFTSCSFTKCSSQTHGGALRCMNGASLAVHSCSFVDNQLTRNPSEKTEGGALYFEGQSTGGLTIVESSFLRSTAFLGGAISCRNAASIHVEQGNITEGKCVPYIVGEGCFGGGLIVSLIPPESIVKNVRLERCSTDQSGGSLDNSEMQGSITYSNILVSESSTKKGNCIFTYVVGSPQVTFFSCMFFGNTVDEQINGQFAGVDLRFGWSTYWKTCLTDPTSFINCFSTSIGNRILYEEPPSGPCYTTFEFLSPPDSTNMNILLPDPQVMVNIETGRDEDGCGASYDFRCKTLKFVGEHMIPMKDGVILVEAGRYEESTTIDIATKSTTFSSFGTGDPVVVYSGETPFITKTIGAFTLRLFTFQPKSGRMLLSQTDAGMTTISDCVIRLNEETSTPISEPLFKTTAGTLTMSEMTFTGLMFSGGCCVSCLGTTTTLDVQNSSFVGLSGQSEPCLTFTRDSKGGTLTLSQIEIEGTAGSLIGGITTRNVQTISLSVITFSRLLSTTQEAPLSITSCDTLTLSSLLFENCAGQSASSLFVDSSSSVSLDTPIASSFSVCSSPRSSVKGDTASSYLPHPETITIDPEDGTDEQFCWSTSVGCQSLSGILDQLMPIHEFNLKVAEGTTSESTLSITSKKAITVTGLGSARSLVVMQSTDHSFADLTDGSLTLASLGFTESSSQTGVSRQKSFFDVKGGSLRLERVEFIPLSFSGDSSLVKMSGASTLFMADSEFNTITQTGSGGGAFLNTNGDSNQIVMIASCSFESVSSEGDGGVILAQLGTRSNLTVIHTTFKSCSSSWKGGALSIVLSSTGSFALQAGTSFEYCSDAGRSAVFVEAPSLASVITETSMAFLAPFPLTPTPAMVDMHRGWNTANTSDAIPLVLFLAEVGSTGFASSDGSDGEPCGFSVYPCSSINLVQTRLEVNGSKTEGKLNPITIELQTALEQSKPFVCGDHTATITGNTITLSDTGQFTTSSADSALTLSALSLYFALSPTQPAISVSTGSVVVSDCTIENGMGDIFVLFGSVSGGSLKLNGTNTFRLISKFYPLFIVSSGFLNIESGTLLTHSDTTRIASLFDLSGGSTTIDSLVIPSLVFDSASSVFSLTNTASLYLSSIAFTSISNEGSGSVIHSSSTGTLSLSSVSFSSCNCGANWMGRSVFISRSSFSVGDVVMQNVWISTAGTIGSHEVYLEGEDVDAVVTSDWVSLIGPNDTLTKGQLEQVFGSDSTNSTNIGPLGYHLYPHTEGAVFVSEGFWDHGKCGQEHLPCSTLDFAFSLLTDTKTTLSLSSDITLSIPLSSPSTGASISSSSSSPKSLNFESSGQFVVDIGPLSFSSLCLTLHSSITQPLFVVKGSTLTLSDTVTITNPSSATHSASVFSIDGGILTLSGTMFDFTVHFSSSSPLLTQTGGTLKLDTVTLWNVRRTVGDGSIVHSTLSSSKDRLEIIGCFFSSCSSTGNGGVLFVSSSINHNPANLIIQITFGSDINCGLGKKGEWIFLRGRSLESYLHDSTWAGSITTLVAPTDDALLWGEDESEEVSSEYASLSLLYYLKGYSQPTIAVGDGGRDGDGCGRTHLKCLSLSTAVSHLSGSSPFEVEIVSSLTLVNQETFSLSFTMKPSDETATIAVGENGAFEVSANIVTLSTLTFDGKGTERSTSLLSIVDTGSITIAGCTFQNLKTSGTGSVFSSTLNTGNTLSISESSFSSCSSEWNGGALFVDVNGGSFVIPTALTFTACSSEGKGQNLFVVNSDLESFLRGGSLDGIKPTLHWNDLVSNEEKEKWFGSSSMTGESSSLLFFWHPHTEWSGAVHVHENGESHSLCGLPQLPCSLVKPSLSKTTTDNKTIIDSDFILNESITTANMPSTLTSVSKSVTVSVGVDGWFALSSGLLTLSTLSFVQSSSVDLEHALISVGSASSSLIVDDCSFMSFSLSLNALIEHSCSSLTLKSSVFADIVRLEGDGGVLKSVMEEGMELDVDSVELASVWTLSGDGDGFFISFNSISDPSKIPSFTLHNLQYSESAGSGRNSEKKTCFVWIEGKRLSEWVCVSDARFVGSYSPIGMESEWLWSVDWEEGLNASLLFYLVAHSGPIGVSSSGYSIVQCGYSGVWCLGLEYGMAVADSKGEKQLNIHNTVEITHLIDLNAEYRVHGKVGSSMLSVVGSGGLVVDSGEHVEIDTLSVIAAATSTQPVFSCTYSELVLDSLSFSSAGSDPSQLIDSTLICVDGAVSVGQFSSLTLLSGLTAAGKLLEVKQGTVTLTGLTISSSISSTAGLVHVCGGSFSLPNTHINDVPRPSLKLVQNALMKQEGGIVSLSKTSVSLIARDAGSGGVISSTLNTGNTLSISESTFTSCSSGGDGGCVAVAVAGGTLLISHSSFRRCWSMGRGGALLLDFSSLDSFEDYKLSSVSFGRVEEKNTAESSGNDVFVIGVNLGSVIVGSQWVGSFSTAVNSDLMGFDSVSGKEESLLRYLIGDSVFVSCDGDDMNSGSLSDPLKTLSGVFSTVLDVVNVAIVGSASIGRTMEIGMEEEEEESREIWIGGESEGCSLLCSIERRASADLLGQM